MWPCRKSRLTCKRSREGMHYQSLVVNQDELCNQKVSMNLLRLYLLHKLKVGNGSKVWDARLE